MNDDFVSNIRREYLKNQQRYNARNPILKLWDRIKLYASQWRWYLFGD